MGAKLLKGSILAADQTSGHETHSKRELAVRQSVQDASKDRLILTDSESEDWMCMVAFDCLIGPNIRLDATVAPIWR